MIGKEIGAKIFGNATILVATQVITKLCGTVLTIGAARMLGVEDYGFYVFAGTFGFMIGLIAGFGFPQLVTREVARDMSRTGEVLGGILVLEIVLSAVSVAAMIGILLLLGYPSHRLWVVTIAGFAMVIDAVLSVIAAFFRGHQRMELEAVMRIVLSFLNMGLGLAVLFAGYGVLGLVTTQLAVFVSVLVMGLYLVVSKLSRPIFPLDVRAYRTLLISALPFAVSGIFIVVYDSMGVLFISFLKGDELTGLYSGAMNFVRVFLILPASLVGAFLPAMSQSWPSEPEAWAAIVQRALKYLLLVALPITLGLAILSNDFVLLMLGNEYADSASILRIAAWVIVLGFLNHGFTNAIISTDREKNLLVIVGVIVLFSVGANLVLVPVWGAYGAVAASLLTEGLMLFIQFCLLTKVGLRLSVGAIAIKPVLSVVLMAVVVYLVQGLGLVLSILIGATIYPAALFALRTFDDDELASFRHLWKTGTERVLERLKRKPVGLS